MVKKIIILFLTFACFLTVNTKAIVTDLAWHTNKLSDAYINISETEDNAIWFDVSAAIGAGRLAPDNAYYGNLIINNDTSTPVKLTNLMPAGAVPITNGTFTEAQMKFVLTNWMYMSFNSDAGNGLNIPDKTIANFGNAQWDNSLISGFQVVQTDVDISGSNIILNPGDFMTLYYDFTYSWETDNRANSNMPFLVGFDILYEEAAATYQITTEVVNGEIDQSVTNISAGASQVINFKSNDGYVLAKVIVDGQEIAITEGMASYEFTDIASDHTISVEYKKQEINDNQNSEQKDNKENNEQLVDNPQTKSQNNTSEKSSSNTVLKTKIPFTGNNNGLLGLTMLAVGLLSVLEYRKNNTK